MSAKMGRPKIDNPKEKVIRARVNEEISNKIDSYCKENEITRSDFVRKCIEDYLNKVNKK